MLQRLRVKLEEPALGDVTTILDLEGDQYISRHSLLEAALSAVEQKKVQRLNEENIIYLNTFVRLQRFGKWL